MVEEVRRGIRGMQAMVERVHGISVKGEEMLERLPWELCSLRMPLFLDIQI